MIGSMTAWFCGVQQPFSYITVIDAGSVHTSVFTYRYTLSTVIDTGSVHTSVFTYRYILSVSTVIDAGFVQRTYVITYWHI